MVNFVSFLVNIDMTALFLFHSSPQLFQFLYFLSFLLLFSFVYFSVSLHQVSSYFLFIFYSPVLIFFCSFLLLPLNVNLYISFPSSEYFLVCGLLFFLPFSFVLSLTDFIFPLILLPFPLHPSVLLHSCHPSVPLLVSSHSSHYHIFSSIFLPPYFFLSFHFRTLSIFLLSAPRFRFSYFSFPLLKLPGSKMIALKSIKVYVSVSHLCLPF